MTGSCFPQVCCEGISTVGLFLDNCMDRGYAIITMPAKMASLGCGMKTAFNRGGNVIMRFPLVTGLAGVVQLCSLLLPRQTWSATWYVRPEGAGSKNGATYADAWDGLNHVVWGSGGVTNGDILYICGTHVLTMTNPPFSQGELRLLSGVTVRGDYIGEPGTVFCGARWQMPEETNWLGPDANGVYWNPAIGYGSSLNRYSLVFQLDGTNIIRLNYKTNTTWAGDLGSISFIGNTNFVKTSDGSRPNGNLATINYGWYFNITGLSDVQFKGLRVIGPMFQNGKSSGASNVTFVNCTMSDECVPFLTTGNDYWTFDGCDISWATAAGIYAYDAAVLGATGARNLTVTNCYIHDIDFGRYTGSDGHGIGVRMFAEGYTITHNRIEATGSAIEFFGSGQTNNTISYNFIKDTHACGTDGGGISLTGAGSKIGFKIYGNVLANIGTNSTESYQGCGIAGGTEDYVELYNNTIYNANVGIRFGSLSAAVKLRIVNNLIAKPRYSFLTLVAAATNAATVIDHNLYWTNRVLTNPFIIYPILPHDAHGIFADPLFFSDNPTEPKDVRVRASSRAIRGGTAVGLVADFSGTLIPTNVPPDIGAFQFLSSTDLIAPPPNLRIGP